MFGEEEIAIGRNILRESDLEISIQYDGEQFTLKYPTPAMMAAIETEIARRLGGYPRNSFSENHVASIEAYVTVDATFIPDKCPSWFKGPWLCYDETLVAKLFDGYLLFRSQFKEKLRKGGFKKTN